MVVLRVTEQLENMQSEARTNLISYASLTVVITVLSIVLCTWYAFTANQMISSVANYASQLGKDQLTLGVRSVASGNLSKPCCQLPTFPFQKLKKESEKLVQQLLPKVISDRLLSGESVDATSFDSASIFCSDIVSFTVLASKLRPLEVVDLLNNLYM